MTHTFDSTRTIAVSFTSALVLLMSVHENAMAKDGQGNERPPSISANATPAAKAKPRDQRRQADHRGSNDAAPDRAGRGAGPDHDIYPGGKLPSMYHNNRSFVVDDWRAHHLDAPPRGYHWVQTGADYVLVAIVGGVVAKVLVVD